MDLSIVAMLLFGFAAVLFAFLPYNQIRDIVASAAIPIVGLFSAWAIDKWALDYRILLGMGQAVSAPLASFWKAFSLTTLGVESVSAMILGFVLFLLAWGACGLAVHRLSIGVAPWKISLTLPIRHAAVVLLGWVGFGFAILVFLAGTRGVFYVEEGFLSPVFESLYPYARCFA